MPLNIKSPETYRLATELARLTGETLTQAVTEAVRERLERVSRQRQKATAAELLAIGQRCAVHLHTVEGHWRHSGILYRDDLVRIVVDVGDTPRNRQWMRQFKNRWKARLEQLELWMVGYRLDIE